ncbi:MAG: FAD binding domain-containing protein [Spirochaetaceae bacterium]
MIKEFVRPSSVEEAAALGKEGYVLLAGGTQVNNAPFKKWGAPVEKVASLDALGLGGVEYSGERLIIGAGVTLQELTDTPIVPEPLRQAAGFIPTRSVRNIATIGGNVGANRPDSYVIPALIALRAVAVTPDGELPVEAYVSQEREDLILSFALPPTQGACCVAKESRSHLSLPVVSAAVRLATSGDGIREAVVAAGCVAPHVVRLPEVERYVVEARSLQDGALEERIADSVEPFADILGSVEYKRYINSVIIADLIRRCAEEVSE